MAALLPMASISMTKMGERMATDALMSSWSLLDLLIASAAD